MKTKLISRIYRTLQAENNCKIANNSEWQKNHSYHLDELEKLLPSGSGIDSGCKIDRTFKNNQVKIFCDFHNMDENGYYCGWSRFIVVCKPEFDGIDIKITGKDKYFVKDYLYDLFDTVLNEEIEFSPVS